MIKLNLLPSYIHENRRAWIVLIIFLVLLAMQGGVFFKAYIDLQARESWYGEATGPGIKYFKDRVTKINAEKTTADGIGTKADVYTKYSTFFTRGEVVKYNYSIADAMAEVANSLGTTKGAWYEKIVITPDKKFTANGQIHGLMNFVNYYFKIKKMGAGWTLTPMAKPYAPKFDAMNQQIKLEVAGAYTTEILKPPAAPDSAEYTTLYNAAGANAANSGQAAAPGGGAMMPGPSGPGMPPPGGGTGMPSMPAPPPPPSAGPRGGGGGSGGGSGGGDTGGGGGGGSLRSRRAMESGD